jgi:hypothetical protein
MLDWRWWLASELLTNWMWWRPSLLAAACVESGGHGGGDQLGLCLRICFRQTTFSMSWHISPHGHLWSPLEGTLNELLNCLDCPRSDSRCYGDVHQNSAEGVLNQIRRPLRLSVLPFHARRRLASLSTTCCIPTLDRYLVDNDTRR